ncbi:neuraminidase-like domain-containing protein [Azorhizobium doebereinerae]|uniref:Tc toxin subunit A-related protein n=1 Tax=Azorhizobium doebereinerae TaxID=281091 RepID=UPI0003FCD86E|nr:neuraminidase-like domain-containing protein [Azorhizobium doebereinerae]
MDRKILKELAAGQETSLSQLKRDKPEVFKAVADSFGKARKEMLIRNLGDAPASLKRALGALSEADLAGEKAADLIARAVDGVTATQEEKEALLARLDILRQVDPGHLDADVPLALNPALAGALARAELFAFADAAKIKTKTADALAQTADDINAIDDAALAELVAGKALADREAKAIGFRLSLYHLVDGDTAAAMALSPAEEGAAGDIKDLLALSREQIAARLKAARVAPPEGATLEQVAQDITRKLQARFPFEALRRASPPPQQAQLARSLKALEPLARADPHWLTRSAGALDLPGVTAAKRRDMLAARETLARTAARYPGLQLDAVFRETADPAAAAKIAAARIGLIDAVVRQNPDVEFLALDYTPGSQDLARLKTNGIAEKDLALVVNTFKAEQRIFAVTDDPELSARVLEAGYASSLAIAREDFETFSATSGLSAETARTIYDRASGTLSGVSALVGSVIDVVKGGFGSLGVGNLFEDVSDGLKAMEGYADLFGPTEVCDCDHCQSILSPAAYFVDLMYFIEQHVTSKVFTGTKADHALSLKVRRADLWTLPLTCANTNTLLPTLVVVNEILEAYITGKFSPATNVGDREAVEAFVYGTRLPQAKASFVTPFVLASAKADAYLEPFERSRADLVKAAGAGGGAREAAAVLKIAKAEYDMLVAPNTGWPYLRELYAFDFSVPASGIAAALEVQEILPATGLARAQFGDLVETKFVRADGTRNVRIEAQKRDASSVQNDVERILGLNAAALDAMHRFVRLWRLTPWTVGELDLLLKQRSPAAPAGLDAAAVADVAQVLALTQRFGLPLDEACALWSAIPRVEVQAGRRSLFDRLYNNRPYALTEGMLPKPAVAFVHPAFRPSATPLPADNTLQRLLLATRLSEEELGNLIAVLATPLGANLAHANPDSRGFALNAANLSLLYRHARLMKLLRRAAGELKQLLAFAAIGGGAVNDLAELRALLDFDDWVRAGGLSLDDLAVVTGGTPLAAETYPVASEVAARIVAGVAADGALLFAATVFAFLPGVTEEQSKAVVAANAGLFEAQGQGMLRLKAATGLAPALVIPAGIATPLAAFQAALAGYHAGHILPVRLAAELGLDGGKLAALAGLAGIDLATPAFATALQGGALAPLEQAVATLAKLALLFKPAALTPDRLAFLGAHKALLGIAGYTAPTLAAIRTLKVYEGLIAPRPPVADADAPDPAAVEAALAAFTPAQKFAAVPAAVLGAALGVAPAVATAISALASLANAAAPALAALAALARLSRDSGIGAETIKLLSSEATGDLDRGAEALVSALRQRFPDDADFDARLAPLDNRLHGRKRDALADHVIRKSSERFTSLEDLYAYFLIDPQFQGCARTSRVVAAISSCQTYVHRILLNLEQDRRDVADPDHVHVLPSRIPEDEWSWRKNYRVWEANRKVFLWPENYLEPELRDDKTPLFKELEDKLLQQDINEQNVLDAYGDYLSGFEQLANLRIAGAYHELSWSSGQDVLHVFGCTNADPPVYYYWTIDNLFYGKFDPDRAVSYSARRKIDVSIPARTVTPVVHLGRLFLFWNEITTSSSNKVKDGESKFVGYKHKLTVKFTSLRLDGAWTPPQALKLAQNSTVGSGQTISDPLTYKGSIYNYGVPYRQPDTTIHSEAQDGYTLGGFQWEGVYPALYNDRLMMNYAGLLSIAEADLFDQKQIGLSSTLQSALRAMWGQTRRMLHVGRAGSARKLYTPNARFDFGWGRTLTPFALQAAVADIDTFEDFVIGWGIWPDFLSAYRTLAGVEPNKRGAPIASLRKGLATTLAVGGGPNGAGLVLQEGPDATYVFRSFAAEAEYESHRLSTTIARAMSRILFTGGVNQLLDIKTQKSLAEEDHILQPGADIRNAGRVGAIDFRGAMGRYYKEIFFEIPFLIADNLNGRQKFSAAQQWFHYIFDPTATLDPSINLAGLSAGQRKKVLRDRVWHYIEFKNLTPPKLRDILTDEAAIKAYKEDPFNPHAIARLRISAYQKAVVMKYVANLLDWGDSLFTQFTMESVNEAIVLYVMAQEILGRRPVKAGDCGEGTVTPKTYAHIRPTIDRGSEFLLEAESILWIAPKARKFARFKDATRARSYLDYVRKDGAVQVRAAVRAASIYARAGDPPPVEVRASARTMRREEVEGGRPIETEALSIHAKERDIAVMAASEAPEAVRAGVSAVYAEVAPTRFERAALIENRRTSVAIDDNAAISRPVDWKRTRPGSWTVVNGRARPMSVNDSILIDDFRRTGRFGWSIVRQMGPVFCIPENKDLAALWDRVEDRLYKIRNCLDITGARRDLSLFAPEIDPRLLVRARAQGLSIEDVLGASSGNLPPYRFAYLIEKAKQYAGTVQGFGAQLMAALEKRDMEELTRLRNTQALNMTKLNTRLREWELRVAEEQVAQIERQKQAAEYKRDYYAGLLDSDLNGWERAQQVTKHTGLGFYTLGALFGGTAGVLGLIPQIGSPFAMKYGGQELNNSFKGWSMCFSDTAKLLDMVSASMGLEASFERRREGWDHQVDLANHEIKQIDKQLSAAKIRVDIAQRGIELHQKNIEDQEEVIEFFVTKFSNLGLYNWLSATLQRLYRQSFNSAHAMARLAERAYRFERDDEATPLLDATYWDASQAGLLAGERLTSDLLEMERRFIETNYRTLEVDQTFSLMQLDPAELLTLRETGTCEIVLPEVAFDLFYPGQYRRKIKAARITIPCVTGPYTNISAELTLKQSFLRKSPGTAAADLVEVPLRHVGTVATSTAQNDAGVFDFSFRDERYMPFEGAGAASVWTLTLPRTFRPFDYATITDVLMHISYSALTDGVLRAKVEDSNAALEGSIAKALTDTPMARVFSLRQDFSSTFQRLLNSPPGTPLAFELDERSLPFFLKGRALTLSRALLMIRTGGGATGAGASVTLDTKPFNAFAATPEFPGWRTANVQAALGAGLLGKHTLALSASGDLAPAGGDPAAGDPMKLLDVALYVEVTL